MMENLKQDRELVYNVKSYAAFLKIFMEAVDLVHQSLFQSCDMICRKWNGQLLPE
jgi:hypothetical protein